MELYEIPTYSFYRTAELGRERRLVKIVFF